MKSKKLKILCSLFVVIITCFMVITLTGCGSVPNSQDTEIDNGTHYIPDLTYDDIPADMDSVIEDIAQPETNTSIPDTAQLITQSSISLDKNNNYDTVGEYVLNGDINCGTGRLRFRADSTIYLNNTNLSSTDKKPITIEKKDDNDPDFHVTIVVVDGTTNTITTTADDKDGIGTDFSLDVIGSGRLDISATDDGISAKERLYVRDATINITASGGHALKGDSVVISNATITTTTGEKDGVHAESDYDGMEKAPTFDINKGYVVIENSKLNLTTTSSGDGIQADTFVSIDGGEYTIKTNGGAPTTVTENSKNNANGKGIKVGAIDYTLSNSEVEYDLDSNNYVLKIASGTFNINSNDDALHSDGKLFISGGTFNIASGDDGVHADELLQITGGNIDITKSYEGLEGAKVEIGGDDTVIKLVASDDGINAADGTSNYWGANPNCHLIIAGGSVTVNASGDGLDSNGTMLISGGVVNIHGPTSSGDGALDSDGTMLINGGTVFSVGSSGMVQTPSENSEQNIVAYTATSNITAGTKLSLRNSAGTELATLTTQKVSRSVIISHASLEKNQTYSIYSDSTKLCEFTQTSTVTKVGTSTNTRPR